MGNESLGRKIFYALNSGKNPKFVYYLKNMVRQSWPKAWLNKRLDAELAKVECADKDRIMERVDYYCKLAEGMCVDGNRWAKESVEIGKQPKSRQSVYYYDAMEYGRWFDQQLRWILKSGDVDVALDIPTIVKSRPIHGDNSCNVLLNLNKVRHFLFVNDKKSFAEKKDVAIFRGKIGQSTGRDNQVKMNRFEFASRFYGHPMFDIGAIGKQYPQWESPKLTIAEQLEYKFVMSLEGNDVASNLKWIMSSNSIAVSPLLTCETWFMEGKLKPDVHYIAVAPDFSDIEDKLKFYINHPEMAQKIIDKAHEHVAQFLDGKRERLISLLVLQKYLRLTNNL